MLKYFLIALLAVPTLSYASSAEQGCRVVADYTGIIALAKNYGLEHDNAIDWVADLPYREPWSDILAASVEQMYSDANTLSPEQTSLAIYFSCLAVLKVE